MPRRLLLVVVVVLATASTAWWTFGAWVGWSVGPWLAPRPFVIDETLAAATNIVALGFFAIRRSIGALIAAQAANILFSIAAALLFDPWWLVIGISPAIATMALALLVGRSTNATARIS